MTNRQELELRRAQIAARLREIGDAPAASLRQEQGELVAEYAKVDRAFQAALISSSTENQEDAEGVEFRALARGCNLGSILDSVIAGTAPAGREGELQAATGLNGDQIPLILLRDPDRIRAAVTPAPSDVGQNQQSIVPGVFPASAAAFLGVDMPTVGVGEAIYPVLTTNATVHVPAENAAAAETTGSFSADVLSPARLQASFHYSREDRARFRAMDVALRENLSAALSDALDGQILAGTNGLFGAGVLTDHDAAAVTSYANYISDYAYARVDGTYANSVRDLRIVMGSGTYAHAAGAYRATEADRSALDRLMMDTGGVRVSAHVPAVMSSKQESVIRLGSRRDMVAPVWEGVTLIPDQITLAANGQIRVTAVLLFAVKLLRAAAFFKQEAQHA